MHGIELGVINDKDAILALKELRVERGSGRDKRSLQNRKEAGQAET